MSACYFILAHVTWVLAWEWALFIRAPKTVTWALTREWALVWDTTVYTYRGICTIIVLHCPCFAPCIREACFYRNRGGYRGGALGAQAPPPSAKSTHKYQ